MYVWTWMSLASEHVIAIMIDVLWYLYNANAQQRLFSESEKKSFLRGSQQKK